MKSSVMRMQGLVVILIHQVKEQDNNQHKVEEEKTKQNSLKVVEVIMDNLENQQHKTTEVKVVKSLLQERIKVHLKNLSKGNNHRENNRKQIQGPEPNRINLQKQIQDQGNDQIDHQIKNSQPNRKVTAEKINKQVERSTKIKVSSKLDKYLPDTMR